MDFTEIKKRQQATWATGDFHKIGVGQQIVGERLCEDIDITAGERVLDVACGSGNTALAAARRGARTVGLDYVPALLERGRRRAEAEGLEIEFVEGDAENLPFGDGDFDAVITTFGAIFGPDQQRVADELLRVVRPGGRIGMANWTPAGFAGELFRLTSRFVPPPPGVPPATNWGSGPAVARLFGDRVAWVTLRDYTARMRAPSAEAWIELFREFFGPVSRAFSVLDEERAAEYTQVLKESLEMHNRATDGTIMGASEYVNVIAVKR